MTPSEVRKKYVGKFYVRRRHRGPTSIYRVEKVVYNRKEKEYDLHCIELTYGSSNGMCISYFNWEPDIYSIEHFGIELKECDGEWVKRMIGLFKEDLDKFASGKQYYE